jgi:RNA polymerase sigma factor (sigma-70 family)
VSPTSNAYADDLELARLCIAGDEQAWERFVLAYRPVLYRAADALEPGGGARDLADAMYADLYGAQERSGDRQSLLRYFQGRSSLATWLRAVLSQRYVDRVRARRRFVPLPEGEETGTRSLSCDETDADRRRYLELMQEALAHAIARLNGRDRLRLACYYLQGQTLSDVGRLLREHEATVSRQLARTRRAIRAGVEQELREERGLTKAQIAECFDSTARDVGPLDLEPMLLADPRKKSAEDRSI